MAKKFKFKLDKILDIKISDEKDAIRKLKELELNLLDINNNLNEKKNNYLQNTQKIIKANIREKKIIQNYLIGLKKEISKIEDEIKKITREILEARQDVINKQIDRKTVEKLKSKKLNEYIIEIETMEQKELDEYALKIYRERRDK